MNYDTKNFVKLITWMQTEGVKRNPSWKSQNHIYESFINDKCYCGKKLYVQRKKVTDDVTEWFFQCGHSLRLITLKESTTKTEGAAYTRIDINNNESRYHKFQGDKKSKEADELSAVKNLCYHKKQHLIKFVMPQTDSPTDVVGMNQNSSIIENFQVTKLYDQAFWKKLSFSKEATITLDNLSTLISSALERRDKYPEQVKEDMTLVIDAGPGLLNFELIKHVSFKESKYNEIWITGVLAKGIHKLK